MAKIIINFRLSKKDSEKLKQLAFNEGITKTAVLENLIRNNYDFSDKMEFMTKKSFEEFEQKILNEIKNKNQA